MTLPPPHFWLILLVTVLIVFSRPAQGDTATASTRMVEGYATTQAGKPLARVTLYLFGLPPGQTDMMTLGEQTTVVTDDQGHFTWAVPAALPPLSAYIGVRSIACYALAADRGSERFRLAVRPNWHGTDAEGAARDLLEQATRPCETKWQTGGPQPIFSVVVPDMSTILLTVRGPNGQPLHAKEVQVVPVGMAMDYKGAVVYTGRTDDAGCLRLRCFPGPLRLQVFVPGLGFGSTGMFDGGAGQSVALQLPPIAPFAQLSGTVASALVAPGAAIHLDNTISDETAWYDPRAVLKADGHWTLADVLPGQQSLVLAGGRGESEPVWVTVQPGEQRDGIMIGPKKPLSERNALTELLSLSARPSVVTPPDAAPSVRGRVTDANGRPMVGADVYAVCSYSAGMGNGQKVLAAKTDAAGAYSIPNLPTGNGHRGPFVHLVACQPGFGLAVGDGQSEMGQVSGRWKDVQQDLVLPGSHSGLMVRVLQDGKPAANILVALAAEGETSLFPARYRESDRGEAAQTLRMILAPSGKTGPDGVIRFRDLTPGLWKVTANRESNFNFLDKTPPPSFNVSTAFAVQAGKDQSYTLSLLPPPAEVAFHFAGPDGHPLPAVPASMSVTTGLYPNYGNLSLVPDGAGNGRGRFGAPGLFQITGQVGDRPLDINALAGPYFEGTSLVAVSAATGSSKPISVSTRRVGPASIRVRLLDAQGIPLHGTVTIGDPFASALYAASVGPSGVVVFPNIPLNFFPYTVTAHIAGRPKRLVPSRQNGPLPSDAALIAGTGQPLPQTVRLRGGEETLVTFGPEPPGYVRLRLTGPFASAKDYNIEGRQSDDEPFTETHFDPATGEYLLGPLPAGRRTLRLFRYAPALVGSNLDAGESVVTVQAGKVVYATLTAQSTAEQEALYSSLLSGIVYLPDGKTLAWGARAAIFIPERPQPIRMAWTDTQGHLTLNDFWPGYVQSRGTPPGTPTGPVLAAWLPGANGAVIVPYQPGREERLILPAPISLHGRITVDGHTVLGLPSLFRVRAAYQGKGILNELLTVETTAQADGTFTLAGLTPGTYQVQATRDDIWLSGTQTVTVSERALPDLAFDIAPPGLPVLLRLEDREGKPRPGQELQIVRPDGPLTQEIWPAKLTSDAAGILRVDGLEAGKHFVKIPGLVMESIGFDVQVWTPTMPPATRRIILSSTP